MKNLFAICLLVSIFSACQYDQHRQDDFVGVYEVSIEAPGANEDLEKAKEDMQTDLEKAREDIDDEIKEAQRDIEEELGEDSNLGKAISSFVEGMGHLANSMTDLGESLGEMGINLGTDILGNVKFNAEFQQDGDVVFGKKRGIRISSNDLKWKIENGKMLLWNEDEDEEEDADVYEIKKVSDTEIDLVGEEVVFHLIKGNDIGVLGYWGIQKA